MKIFLFSFQGALFASKYIIRGGKEMFIVQVLLFIFVLAMIIWLLSSIAVVVHQGEVKVVESFGRFVRTLDPGLHFLIPILYTVRQRVSLKQVPLEIPPQSAITRDNVIVQID